MFRIEIMQLLTLALYLLVTGLWSCRATRQKDAITSSLDGEEFTVLRVAHLPPGILLKVGPLVSSPEGEGFGATFSDDKVTILESKILPY